MKRRLFNAIAVVSAVLCLVTCGLWLDSYRIQTWVITRWVGSDAGRVVLRHLDIALSRGQLVLCYEPLRTHYQSNDPPPDLAHYANTSLVREPAANASFDDIADAWRFAGFEYLPVAEHGNSMIFGGVCTPCYAVAIVCGLPAALMIPRWFRPTRAGDAPTCVKCGYDLRATPERCPECGTIPPSRA